MKTRPVSQSKAAILIKSSLIAPDFDEWVGEAVYDPDVPMDILVRFVVHLGHALKAVCYVRDNRVNNYW